MSLRLEKLYCKMPVLLQNLAVSIQGKVYNLKRYSGKYAEYLDGLMRSQWLNRQEIEILQNKLLQELLLEAAENVPFYQTQWKAAGIQPDAIHLGNLNSLPLLEKLTLRTHTSQFINHSRLKHGSHEGHTSGTSGIPLVFPYDLDSIRHNLAFRERQYRWAGLTGKEKSARFSGRLLLGKHNGPPFWRYNRPENQLLFSSYHINDKTWLDYYNALIENKVVFLDGYPSALFSLADCICRAGLAGKWRPWAIFLTGETVMDYQRELIYEAFRAKIYDFYSSSEGAPFVTQCCAGNHHINPESGIIEFLRPDGSYAELGEEAEMVVTSFFQKSLPLIRYRIGDAGILSKNQKCPCGSFFPVIERIVGREDDALYTTERGRIGSAGLSTALYKIPQRLKESQIEQIEIDSFIFKYVPREKDLTEYEKEVILRELYQRLGASVNFQFERVSQIPKGARGKAQLVKGLKRLNGKGE